DARNQERNVLSPRSQTANRQFVRDAEDPLPLASRGIEVEHKPVPSLAQVRDVEGLVGLERRMDEEAKRTAGFQHPAVTRVLRKKRTLRFAPGPQSDTGTA